MGQWWSRCDHSSHYDQNERIKAAEKQAEEYKRSGQELAREKAELEKQHYGYLMAQQAQSQYQAMAVRLMHLAQKIT